MDDTVIAFEEWIVQIIEFQNTYPHSTILSHPKNGLRLILKGCMPIHTEVIADGGTIKFKVKENAWMLDIPSIII